MAAPLSPTKLFTCDGCGATLPLDESRAGKKCRCGKCGKVLVVPGHEPEEPAELPAPETVAFYCLKCDTRLVAYVTDVGKKAKCPECGAKREVPAPAKVRPKHPPRAMHGQQYGLWGVDEAPLPSELAARQPKFYPVYCRVCDTLMHAHAGQVGGKLKCPDCGAETVVPSPPVETPRDSVLVPDGEEYQLDETQELPERPTYVPYKMQKLAEDAEREAKAKFEAYERPVLPSNPLLEGVWRMLLRSPLPQVIFAFAFALALEAWFIANAMANVGGLALIIVLVSYGTTFVFGALSLVSVSAYWLAVLKESSEGNSRLHNPPGPVFVDWAAECFYLVFAAAICTAPGMLAEAFIPGMPLGTGVLIAMFCWVFFFPVVLLSQLENGSPLELISPRVVRTLGSSFGPWFLFYVESILLVGVTIGAIMGAAQMPLVAFPVAVLFVSAASFLYFRLLGRLAWWIAERTPAPAEDANQEK